ncbi:YceI family protein [Dysgonomonas sp. 216]|uniref:YceI family protein n=1 Tax=Dysgonomonas sp. 216 TaxID=2302934 RepID=UPI0013D49D0F|nr:YceI family protein [Dysgonomonas sp. 216]NDW19501.1 YceI family protein [Dysgonomonas sp. 216]
MKLYYYALLFAVLFLGACNNSGKNKIDAAEAQDALSGAGKTLVVDSLQSEVMWKGFKPGGSHVGTLAIQSGTLVVDSSTIKEGHFVFDLNKIVNLDLTDESMNKMLVDHLKSADFFDVAKFPVGEFVVTKTEPIVNDTVNYLISGNLKLKDVTKNITFGAKVTKEGNLYKAKTQVFTIDRTQWGVNYGSKNVFADLKDKFINDDIELQVTIIAKVAE